MLILTIQPFFKTSSTNLCNCYFHSVYWNYRGELKDKSIRHDIVRRSEDIGRMFVNDREMQRGINGTTGIFYYESDLWNKKELKKQLHKLVDEVLKNG